VALLAFFLVVIPAPVAGAAVDVSFSQTMLATCAEPITPADVLVTVQNLGGTTDSYSLTLGLPDEWEGQIKQTVTLGSGESKTINPFLVSSIPLTTVPGDYKLTVHAASLSNSADTASTTLSVKILPCFAVTVIPSVTSHDVCQESTTPQIMSLTVTNNGKFTDTFTLAPSVSWAKITPTEITLGPDEHMDVTLTLTPPIELKGSHDILVTATSATFPATDTEHITLNLIDCFATTLNIEPSKATVCQTESADYTLTLKNSGSSKDTLTIAAPNWITLPETTVTLAPGDIIEMTITAHPIAFGSQPFEITATSHADGTVFSDEASITVNDCRGVTITTGPSDIIVCQGEDLSFTALITNTGTVQTIFNTTSTAGVLSHTKVSLLPDESQEVSLMFDTTTMEPGTKTVTITVSAPGNIQDSTTLSYTIKSVEACSVLSGETMVINVLPGKAEVVALEIQNPTKVAQQIVIEVTGPTWVFATPQLLELEPSERDTIFVYANPPLTAEKGSQEQIIVTATSPLASTEVPITVILGEKEDTSVIGNATFGNEITGQLLRAGAQGDWKTAAVAVITILIILVLVIRLVFIVRK